MAKQKQYGNGGALATAGLQGAASGAAAGAAVLPPWGAIVGGAIGGVSSLVGANSQLRAEAQAAEQSRIANLTESRMAQYNIDNDRKTQIPTFEFGGVLSEYYGPNARAFQNTYGLGGDINAINERNSMGYRFFPNGGYVENPAWYESNALKMEVGGMLPTPGTGLPNGATMAAYKMAAGGRMPEGMATLKEAREYEKLYPEEMEFGTKTEWEHTDNKKLASRIAADHLKDSIKMNNGAPPDYYKKLQAAGISDELNKLPLMTMAAGGPLSASKASEMLKDGKIRGKKLSERQKAYFQAIAHGWKPGQKSMGGTIGGQPMDFPNSYAFGGPYDMTMPQDTIVKNNSVANPGFRMVVPKATPTVQRSDNPNAPGYNTYQQPRMGIGVGAPQTDYSDVTSRFTPTKPGDIRGLTRAAAYERDNQTYQKDLAAEQARQQQFLQMMQNNQISDTSMVRAFGGSVPQFAGTGRILDATNKGGSNTNGTNNSENILTEYKGGGTHEQNKYGGIQVGGKAKVEEGEFRFDDPDNGESYVFSNRF